MAPLQVERNVCHELLTMMVGTVVVAALFSSSNEGLAAGRGCWRIPQPSVRVSNMCPLGTLTPTTDKLRGESPAG